MRKIICLPNDILPEPNNLDKDTKYILLYSKPDKRYGKRVGYIAPSLIKNVLKAGINPTEEVWDFTTIALSVIAADFSLLRKKSADGWTREIELTIHLNDVQKWNLVKEKLEKTLRFLTGDFWFLTFKDRGESVPSGKNVVQYDCDCVSLLSGGLDSLTGGIDLISDGHKPLFVSQTVRGDGEKQVKFAEKLTIKGNYFQWSHKFHQPGAEKETSTRSRSIIFFAYAALASCGIRQENKPVPIYVCENGFISLNIPSTILRSGSFSTKTTHPVYMAGIQNIWNTVGINAELLFPYRYKTKGELLSECKNQKLLKEIAFLSTSCGKFLRNGSKHCGRCVPCLVRRAAFYYANITDKTQYRFDDLKKAGRMSGADDLNSIELACIQIEKYGIDHFISGNLSFATPTERKLYVRVVEQGYRELSTFLKSKGVL
jgi:hypothetical protein